MRAAKSASPQAPDTSQFLQGLLGRFYVTGSFWFRIHHFGATRTPRWTMTVCMPIFCGFFFVALRRIRKAIAGNLEVVLGPCGWWTRQRRIWRTIWNFAWCLTERYEQFAPGREQHVDIENRAAWDAVSASPRGFLMVTAHVGNWEMASRLPAGQMGRTVHVVREPEMNPQAQEFVQEIMAGSATENYRTHFLDDDPGTGAALLGALRDGDLVALQVDRPSAGGKNARVELFDRPLDLPLGPIALARAAGALMIPVFVYRTGRSRYRIRFRAAIRIDSESDLEVQAQRVAREVEWAIRQEPHQWFCFHSLWP